MEQTAMPTKKSRSTILNLPINIMGVLVFCIPALFAWIPIAGYFSWIIPMYIFMAEKKSNFVRFCSAESLFISTVRLVFAVVFDGIYNVALHTVDLYGQNQAFVDWWGDISAPGQAAHTIGIICAGIFTILCIIGALMAYRKKLFRLPVVSDVADYMTKELKPISKQHNHSSSSIGSNS